jgi:hypothetical protein
VFDAPLPRGLETILQRFRRWGSVAVGHVR